MSLRNQAAKLVERLRNDARGLTILAEWLGKGGIPVDLPHAERRANTCAGCPKNQPLNRRIENTAAEAIRKQEEVRHQVELRTSHDARLHNCGVCSCYLKLKVWVPLANIPEEPGFPSWCWLVTERNQPPPAPDTPPADPVRPVVRIRRENAFGDVIQASILATKLWVRGYEVWWRCSDAARPALLHHPHIAGFIADKDAPVDVNLDQTYEGNLDRRHKDLATLFLEASDHQLRKGGMGAADRANRVPHLGLTQEEIRLMRLRLRRLTGRIVAYVPASAHWPSRTIDPSVVIESAKLIKAKVVWAYNEKVRAPILHDIGIKTFRELMALIYLADVVVSPDTGPLHVAAAFNKPIVIIEQAIAAELRLSYQTDWTAVHAPLDCIRCGEFTCPKDANKPPCQKVPPEAIAAAVNTKLSALDGEKVSVVIPVYKHHARLFRCVDLALEQSDEVIVSLDGDANKPQPGIITVPSPGTRTGFGKTCMRGAHASTGSFLLFLNDDCYLKPGAVEAMLDTMRRHPMCAVVGAQLWYPDGTIQHGGTFRANGDIGFGHRDHRSRTPSLTGEHEMEFVTFACALVRRSAFYAVRGFDEEYDTYCEDSDFCLRVREAGWSVWYNANAQAIHDESQTTAPTKAAMHAAANKIFTRKWMGYFQHNPV